MVDGPSTRRDRKWRLISEESWPGPMNMALDEVAAGTAASGGPRTLRVYNWSPSCLSLGYSQDPSTIDWGACEVADLDVTRRPTGGGAIYHDDYGDISYSIIAPADELPGPLLDAYHLLCEPLFTALESLGVDAGYAESEQPGIYHPACYLRTLHPAHDVVLDDQKLSGNAQYRQRDAIIQHGSLSYAVDPERHLRGFADPPTVATFRDRVGAVSDAVDVSRDAVVTAFEEAFTAWADPRPGSWRSDELNDAKSLAASKYRDEAWVRRGADPTD